MKQRHSKGLYLLFTTEMWERFSFYTMRSLLVLYMVGRTVEGGFGWSKGDAISLYGIYMSVAYLTPILGGYVADKFIGQRRSVMIGSFFMCAGHFLMAFSELWIFYTALAFVAVGNGFFKPCLTSILGELYDDSDESQRDSAYSLFYMGINIGAILAGFASGWLMDYYGFHYGFTVAGVAMVVALMIFWWGKSRYLDDVGIKPQVNYKNKHAAPLTKLEKNRLYVIGFLFIMTVFYFIAWEQMGGLVPLFIHESVNRTLWGWVIPTPWLANIDPLFIVVLAPAFSLLWIYLGERNKDPFVGIKMGFGFFMTALSFLLLAWISMGVDGGSGYMPHWSWIVMHKLLIVIGEVCFLPISWAAATKLSPKSYITRTMGLMLAAIGIGSYFAGYFGSYVDEIGSTLIFSILVAGLIFFGIICIILNPILKRISEEGELRKAFN